MSTYIISYDLRSPNPDYEGLHEAIKAYGTWAHITQSLWAVETSESAVEVRDYLTTFIEPGDRLFVLRSGSEAAWRNVMCNNEWLKRNL